MPNKEKIYNNEQAAIKAAEQWSKSGYTGPDEKKEFQYYDEDGNVKNTDTYTSIKRGTENHETGGSINKRAYQQGGKDVGKGPRVPYAQLDKKKGFYQQGGKDVGVEHKVPWDKRYEKTYQQGGKDVGKPFPHVDPQLDKKKGFYQQGGKDVGKPFLHVDSQLDKKKGFYQDGGKPESDYAYTKEKRKLERIDKEEEFDPGVDREEAGNPTMDLITQKPDGGKWLGDERPPMYGASEEHIPFLTTVYEMMDAGENMDQIYQSQSYLRPYIRYITAGQNEVVLPSLENAEGSEEGDSGKGTLPKFMENMSKDEIMNFLKEGFGKMKSGGVRKMEE